MLFSRPEFLFAFFPGVLAVYYLIVFLSGLFRKPLSGNAENAAVPGRAATNLFLFLSSLIFYGWGEPRVVLLLAADVVVIWGAALLIASSERKSIRKVWLCAAVVWNLLFLGIFKYLGFFSQNVSALLGIENRIPAIALPIGISFFTFQAISYVADIYRGCGEAQKNPINVGLYLAFFPQLIAGPIVRYETVAHEIRYRKENLSDFSSGVCRFVMGLGKKALIANQLAPAADAAFGGGEISCAFAWLGAVCYAFQIYFDFSGYSDMAIGLGKIFGFHFLENFDYPYVSAGVTEFWRRWHISLGTYFRDYVYIPLGGSRSGSAARRTFNLFCVWALTGLWHGASWNFVLWGLWYFVLIFIERLTGLAKRKPRNGFERALRTAATLLCVLFGWVLFRAENLPAALRYFGRMFSFSAPGNVTDAVLNLGPRLFFLFAALLLSLPVYPALLRLKDRVCSRAQKKGGAAAAAANAVCAAAVPVFICSVLLLSVAYISKGSFDPFIYFNF